MRVYFSIPFLFVSVSALAQSVATTAVVPAVIVKANQSHLTSTSISKTVLTHAQIQTAGVNSLSQALRELGGIQLQDLSGNGSQVLLSMRGFGSNASSNTLLQVNGIPITNPDLAPPDLNTIPVNEIEYIEIIAGSESVLYGDQAVGGVINIFTRNNTPEKERVSCSAGSYRQANCYLSANRSFAQGYAGLSAGINRTDNYRDHNLYKQNIVMANAGYTYATGSLNINLKLADEMMQYPGALTAAQVRENRRQATNDTDFFRDHNGFLHLKHSQDISAWRLTTDVARWQIQGDGVLFSPFNQNRTVTFIKPQLKGTIANVFTTTGAEFQLDDYHLGSTIGLTNNDQKKFGLFSLATFPLRQNLSASFGVRGAEQVSHLHSQTFIETINRVLVTTAGLSYQWHSNVELYLRRAGSYRFPKADEMASVPNGVTALRAQRGIAYESGIQLNRPTYYTKIGIFQLNLRDEIAFDPTQTPLQPFGANRNLSPTMRRGFTIAARKEFTPRISLGGQYNFVDAKFITGIYKGNQIPLVSESIMRADINFQLNNFWNMYAETIYTGSQFAANDDANITSKLGGYMIYNFNLRYHLKQFEASFRINNIFNKAYYLYANYQPSIQFESFYPAPDRNLLLTLNYNFT